MFEDKKCPNVVCCKSKNIDGCWKCENVADCQTGFFNSGENDAKAYALYIKKYGTEKYTERIFAIINKGYDYPRSFKDINDIDELTLSKIFECAKKIKKVLEKKLNIDGLTFIQNNGDVQEVKHFHLHLKPFYNEKQDIKDVKEIYKILNSEN